MRVAIESVVDHEESLTTVLVVDLCVSRPDNWLLPHQTSVTPVLVREMVRLALSRGWTPREAGPPFTLVFPLIRDRA